MIGSIDFESDSVALIGEGAPDGISYRELWRRVQVERDRLAALPRPALIFAFGCNSLEWVVSYLACLAERIPLALGEPARPAREKLIATYRPAGVLLPSVEPGPIGYSSGDEPTQRHGLVLWVRDDPPSPTIDPRLSLLLMTSGSTGDAKLVRLAADSLLANARSIGSYLQLGPHERAIQSLPLHYSYGLSILNSHLLSGASIALTKHSFMSREFWQTVDSVKCTSFAGVPYMYETLQRLRLSITNHRSIRTLTQAGGHLRVPVVEHFLAQAQAARARLFVMYGQTEATARISYVPSERLGEKLGSIGMAIPGGEMSLAAIDGDSNQKQIIYRGPNVMMGYASTPDDLRRGDELRGVLPTGDIGECDSDGYFFITGRLARFAKLFGRRVNLASVESEIETRFAVRAAAIERSEQIAVFVEGADVDSTNRFRLHLATWLGVPPGAIRVDAVNELPVTASGKKDYKALR